MNIYDDVEIKPEVLAILQSIFEWANEMGLKNKKVFELNIESPGPFVDPFNSLLQINCTIENNDLI